MDRVLSLIVDLRCISSLSFIPLSPSNLRPFGAPPSIGRRECTREPLPLEGAAEHSEAELASFLGGEAASSLPSPLRKALPGKRYSRFFIQSTQKRPSLTSGRFCVDYLLLAKFFQAVDGKSCMDGTAMCGSPMDLFLVSSINLPIFYTHKKNPAHEKSIFVCRIFIDGLVKFAGIRYPPISYEKQVSQERPCRLHLRIADGRKEMVEVAGTFREKGS